MRNHQYFLPAIQCFFLLSTLANHYKAAAADNNELVFQDIPHEEGGDLLSSSLRRSLQLDQSSEISEECQSGTDDLNTFLPVVEATQEIQDWANNQTFQDICSQPTETKIACVVDYGTTDHSLGQACNDVGGMLVNVEYIFECQQIAGDLVLFYTTENYPLCLAVECGIEGAQGYAESLVEQSENTLEAGGDYLCTQVRLVLDDPIMPIEQPRNCPDDTERIRTTEEVQAAMSALENELESSSTSPSNLLEDETYCQTATNNTGQHQECELDFSVLPVNYTMEEACDGTGLYLESEYTIECNHTDGNNTNGPTTLTWTGLRDPICVSRTFCTPQDLYNISATRAQEWFDTIMEQQQQQEGGPTWDCALTYVGFEDFAASGAPTVSPAPTGSSAPSSSPTISPAPSQSLMPSSSPTEKMCFEGSIALNSTDSIQPEINAIQAVIDQESFQDYCTYPADTSKDPYIVTCDFDYTNIQHNLATLCDEQGEGLYVEDTITVLCQTPNNETGGTTETYMTFTNRPRCRSEKCNGKEVKELSELEVDWLVDAKQDEFGEGTQCGVTNAQVLVGGIAAEGGVDPDTVTLSQECLDGTNELGTVIAIRNDLTLTQNDFKDYVAVDLREICRSPNPSNLLCDIDYIDFHNSLQGLCEANSGQYLESSFLTSCQNTNERDVDIVSENVPGCVGTVCSPRQSELVLFENHRWVENMYEQQGYTCETTVLSVFTPNFEPQDVPDEDDIFIPVPEEDDGPLLPIYSGDDDDVEPGHFTGKDFGVASGETVPQFGALWENPTDVQQSWYSSDEYNFTDDQLPDEQIQETSDSNKGLPVGAIVGIVLSVLLCCCCALYVRRQMREEEEDDYDDEYKDPETQGYEDSEEYSDEESEEEESQDDDEDDSDEESEEDTAEDDDFEDEPEGEEDDESSGDDSSDSDDDEPSAAGDDFLIV